MKNKNIPVSELIFELKKMFPHSKTELKYKNHLQLLVSTVLSAQSTDKQVNKATKPFFEVFKTPEDWVKLWEDWIREFIKTIWLYRNKAKFVYKLSQMLVWKKMPNTIEWLKELPWVWVKTAKVFLAETENWPYLAVDTHVHRVLNRLWFVKTKLPEQTDKVADKIFEDEDKRQLHHSLIFFWRYHCLARKPKCETCPFFGRCIETKNWKIFQAK